MKENKFWTINKTMFQQRFENTFLKYMYDNQIIYKKAKELYQSRAFDKNGDFKEDEK